MKKTGRKTLMTTKMKKTKNGKKRTKGRIDKSEFLVFYLPP